MYRVSKISNALAGIVAALAILVAATGHARSQGISEEHLKVAREAVASSQSTRTLDSILPDLSERMKQELIANRPDAADQISEIVDNTAISLAPRRGELEAEVARVYANIFSIEELKKINEFYLSDAGKKLIEQTPVIGREIEGAARLWTNGIRRDLTQEVGKKLEEAGLR